jgi:regulator of protease activity HflC (stomatin/prohibitin superfamily)
MQIVIYGLVAIVFLAMYMVKIINEYERGVVFRLGRIIDPKMPGLNLIIPFVDRLRRVDMRTITMDVPSQDVITKDNVSVKVNAVVYFRVLDVNRAIVEVENYLYATSQLAQTTLRSVCGEAALDDLLVSREQLNARLQDILDHSTDPWGIKVSMVEIKHIDLPLDMQRAMAKEAEAERERRAKIIAAEGEFQAAEKLSQAANVIAREPQALQLRYLQTLKEITRENNSTTIFPLPIDLLTPFLRNQGQ